MLRFKQYNDLQEEKMLQDETYQTDLLGDPRIDHLKILKMELVENKGFAYELELYKLLNGQNISPPNFTPAGGGHGPDGMFMFRGKSYNYEIKLDQVADYGQVELRYKNGSWGFGGKNEEAKELYTSLGVLDFVSNHWSKGGAPRKETISSNNFTQDDVSYDYANFRDGFMPITSSALSSHYSKKGTYYIQIGKAGFYHLEKDIAGLGTPKFNGTLKLRIRIKRRTSKKLNGYGFLTALKIDKKASKSKFDLDKGTEFLKK